MLYRAALLLTAGMFWIAAGAGVGFPVADSTAWQDGSFTNTTVSGDALELAGSNTSGSYRSDVFDAGDRYAWNAFRTRSTLNGGTATVTVTTSNDSFTTVQERETFALTGGTESFNSSSFNASRYIRFNYTLTAGGSSPSIPSTNLTLGGGIHFLIRGRPCQPAETELFSLSNRSNAHAADPGYYSQQHVCASGINTSDYDSVCVGGETQTLSFFGSEQNYTHLSVADEQFDHKLCTGKLSIGIRDSCPATTKAIVSIYELPASHIAAPGVYPNQLCGAVFDEVSMLLQFHLGSNDTVSINGTADPEQGVRRNQAGWDSGFISAANDSLVAGIVSGENTETTGIGYGETGVDHAFNMTQTRQTSQFFVPFTVGDRFTLQNRIALITAGDFLGQFNPNFGYRLAEAMIVQLTLQLTEVDLVTNMILSSGIHRLQVTNVGTNANGEPQVSINVTAR